MIPSLAADEIRHALVDYLATTFALSDDDVRDALAEFLTDPATGIFRGPYVRVRTPFRQVDDDWVSPLDRLPEWFTPYVHQAQAFERLTTAGGHHPEPTLVTTGTGSGKTECFLMPVLDHCGRARDAGGRGIKAILLYPMNALASDQAGRIADLILSEARFAGIRAGLYVGENGTHTSMGEDHLIDDRHVLRDDPPDILLTNYKMLDFLLLRSEDRPLWATTGPDSLRYVVLDEFHTYDGAQGTDVAMLLRRLGATLGLARPDAPLGPAAAVATSATLGSEAAAVRDLREFAGKVFGADFDERSVIGETRTTVSEACRPIDPDLPVPSPAELALLPVDDVDALAAAFCRREPDEALLDSELALGDRLLAHPVTRAVLTAVSERPRPIGEMANEVAQRVPGWAESSTSEPELVEEAVARFLALVSRARRMVGSREAPLFNVEAQLWIREVSRLMRDVSPTAGFAWLDTPGVVTDATLAHEGDDEDGSEGDERAGGADPGAAAQAVAAHELLLPAVSCRRCGHSGWISTVGELSDSLSDSPARIYEAALHRAPNVRAMMRAHPDEEGVSHLDPVSRRLLPDPAEGTIPVHATPGENEAKRQSCPSCAEPDAVRFVGLAVASLASVSITTMFGSDNVAPEERKLLAFTDSVQDASHRAAFFAGRTHRFNLRSLMARALREAGPVGLDLAELGEDMFRRADTAEGRFELLPPDLLRDAGMRTVWSDTPEPEALDALAARVGFEVDLEFGLRSRVGRTLEQSVSAAAAVEFAPDTADLVTEAVGDVLGEVPDSALEGVDAYLLGIGDRLRGSGAIMHPLLEKYVHEAGAQWFIWGGRPRGLPPFTPEQSRPTFLTDAARTEFDSLTAHHTTPTWWVDWAVRSLGIDRDRAHEVNRRVLATLAGATDTVAVATDVKGNKVYGLDRRAVRAYDIEEPDAGAPLTIMRCDLCSSPATVPPVHVGQWVATPCRRYRCGGHYRIAELEHRGYYRRFYRQGRTRRVVTGEHTGLLRRADREALETAFKDGTAPDSPNVLTATPTLEMGIDIGDLSAVMLTSVPRNPASYIQRVGRAGRATGNSLVTTFVRSDTHGLYYLAEPEAMLAGAVRPPNCYLEASETLHRQYVAYLMDRIATGAIEADPMPARIGELMRKAFDERGVFQALREASVTQPDHAESFLGLFGQHLDAGAATRLRDFASGGIEPFLKDAAADWFGQLDELSRRRDRLRDAIDRLEALPHLTEEDTDALRSLRGQRSAVVRLLRAHRDEYPWSALERLGVLPNYTLSGDSVTLTATLWSAPEDDDGDYTSETFEYARPGRRAITEFAPGNSFYVAGHRHRVDALEIGSAREPLYETWRICPECSYAKLEATGEPVASCTRCGGATIADIGARHTLLRLRNSLATAPEESARVLDESDDRTRESYETATLVDPDPTEIRDAWQLHERAFGAEFVARVHLRTLNLGISGRPGETVAIGGREHHVPRFTVCRHCGAVRDVRDDRSGTKPHLLHQGWCKVRSGAQGEQWDPVLLAHELCTEAIRLLVPVSMYEVDERLASFKGAILLGIRNTLGGNPDHLNVVASDMPNRSGQGRRRFLVIYDEVPGGTGYLGPLAEPTAIKAILTSARDAIARCPCRNEGRPACHRCLLGVVGRHEYELVRRDLARDLLDQMLEEPFDPKPVATIGTVDIAPVEESELERRFKVALRQWAGSYDGVTFTQVPGKGRHEAFELTIDFEGSVVRYRISEQDGLTQVGNTIPDFRIQRMDTSGPEVAVYLDGYQFHASAENNNIAADCAKRARVRAEGAIVWNLSWDDVEGFHRAVTADPPTLPPDRVLLSPSARIRAKEVQHTRSGTVDVGALEQNPMALLLDYLVRPDRDGWRRAVLSAVTGMAVDAGAVPVGESDLPKLLDAAQGAQWSDPAPADAPLVMASRAYTPGGLPLALFLDLADPNAEHWTALCVLDDSTEGVESPEHRARWADWLPWANVLQFLGPPESHTAAAINGSSARASLDWDDLWLRRRATSPQEPAGHDHRDPYRPLDEAQTEELDLVMDDEARRLAAEAMSRGAPTPVAGHEIDGAPVDVAWPARHVGILGPGEDPVSGWDLRPATEWSLEGLLRALESRR